MTPQYGPVLADVKESVLAWPIWGRLGWRDTRLRYQRTVLGPFWSTLSLSVFLIVLGALWSQLWKQDPKTYMPYLTSGMITWLFFSSIIIEGSGAFVASEALIKQLRIPFTLLACSVVWRNVLAFGHNILIYIVVFLYADITPSWAMLLVIPGLLLLCVSGVAICLILALICARYRDIQQLIQSLLQISMFLTPIFWLPEQLPGHAQPFVKFNLLFHYVDIIRAPLMAQAPGVLSWIMVAGATAVSWALAVILHSRFRRRIAYWL